MRQVLPRKSHDDRLGQRQKKRPRQSQLKKRFATTPAGEMLRTPPIQPPVPTPHRGHDAPNRKLAELAKIGQAKPRLANASPPKRRRSILRMTKSASSRDRILPEIAFHHGASAPVRPFGRLCELGMMPHRAPFLARRLHGGNSIRRALPGTLRIQLRRVGRCSVRTHRARDDWTRAGRIRAHFAPMRRMLIRGTRIRRDFIRRVRIRKIQMLDLCRFGIREFSFRLRFQHFATHRNHARRWE